ncbi:hypothetical protein DCM91_00645 [Chitinophaga costaii]|nr:hypothetical protein DCM91_00645 [Chitinophaga costaii]
MRREWHSAAAGAFFLLVQKETKSTWRLRKMVKIYCASLRQTKLTIERRDFYWAIVRLGCCTTLGPFAALRSTA